MTITANMNAASQSGRSAMPSEVEQTWAEEVDRRRGEVLLGKVKLVPGEQVFRDAMAKYA